MLTHLGVKAKEFVENIIMEIKSWGVTSELREEGEGGGKWRCKNGCCGNG